MLGLRWSCIDHKWFCAKKLIRAIGALKYLFYNNSRAFAEYFIVFEKKTDISLQICSILIWTSYNWKKTSPYFQWLSYCCRLVKITSDVRILLFALSSGGSRQRSCRQRIHNFQGRTVILFMNNTQFVPLEEEDQLLWMFLFSSKICVLWNLLRVFTIINDLPVCILQQSGDAIDCDPSTVSSQEVLFSCTKSSFEWSKNCLKKKN